MYCKPFCGYFIVHVIFLIKDDNLNRGKVQLRIRHVGEEAGVLKHIRLSEHQFSEQNSQSDAFELAQRCVNPQLPQPRQNKSYLQFHQQYKDSHSVEHLHKQNPGGTTITSWPKTPTSQNKKKPTYSGGTPNKNQFTATTRMSHHKGPERSRIPTHVSVSAFFYLSQCIANPILAILVYMSFFIKG